MTTMAIWFKPLMLEEINGRANKGLSLVLGIEFIEIGDDFMRARMPVDERTHQPHGILHGGASVVLAETIASVGATRAVDRTQYRCVGLEINANHLSSVRDGYVIGTGRPIHLGKSTHVWDVRIADERGKPVCVSRVTMAVLKTAA